MTSWPIVIFEDDKRFTRLLINYLHKNYPTLKVALQTDKVGEIQTIIETASTPYIFLLDIMIGNIALGLRAGKLIEEAKTDHKVIFITSYPDKLVFEVLLKIKAVNIILKRADLLDELTTTLSKTLNQLEGRNLLIYSDASNYIAISLEGIVMIESHTDNKALGTKKIILHHTDGRFTIHKTLSALMKELNTDFYRCHNTYIINIKHIRHINRGTRTVELTGGLICTYSYQKGKPLLQDLEERRRTVNDCN